MEKIKIGNMAFYFRNRKELLEIEAYQVMDPEIFETKLASLSIAIIDTESNLPIKCSLSFEGLLDSRRELEELMENIRSAS